MNHKTWKQFLAEEQLEEITRYEKETGKKFSEELVKEFKKYITDPDNPEYAIHMGGDLTPPKISAKKSTWSRKKMPRGGKLGVKPTTSYETPAGVYFYPLTQDIFDEMMEFAKDPSYSRREFFTFREDAPFIHLVQLNPEGRYLKMDNPTVTSEEEYVDAALKMYEYWEDNIASPEQKEKQAKKLSTYAPLSSPNEFDEEGKKHGEWGYKGHDAVDMLYDEFPNLVWAGSHLENMKYGPSVMVDYVHGQPKEMTIIDSVYKPLTIPLKSWGTTLDVIVIEKQNGTQQWEYFLENGKFTGDTRWSTFDDGKKKTEGEFKDGKKHGKTVVWYESGQKKFEEDYRDGKLHGKVVQWYENGQKASEGEFQDGEPHGKWFWWYQNGQKMREGELKDGKKHGKYNKWHENGQKKEEGVYRDDKLQGLVTGWYPNGQKKTQAEFKNGDLVPGSHKKWDEDGNLLKENWMNSFKAFLAEAKEEKEKKQIATMLDDLIKAEAFKHSQENYDRKLWALSWILTTNPELGFRREAITEEEEPKREKGEWREKRLAGTPEERFERFLKYLKTQKQYATPSTGKINKKATLDWRNMLVHAGFDGAIDQGNKIIHNAEPMQMVMFTPTAYGSPKELPSLAAMEGGEDKDATWRSAKSIIFPTSALYKSARTPSKMKIMEKMMNSSFRKWRDQTRSYDRRDIENALAFIDGLKEHGPAAARLVKNDKEMFENRYKMTPAKMRKLLDKADEKYIDQLASDRIFGVLKERYDEFSEKLQEIKDNKDLPETQKLNALRTAIFGFDEEVAKDPAGYYERGAPWADFASKIKYVAQLSRNPKVLDKVYKLYKDVVEYGMKMQDWSKSDSGRYSNFGVDAIYGIEDTARAMNNLMREIWINVHKSPETTDKLWDDYQDKTQHPQRMKKGNFFGTAKWADQLVSHKNLTPKIQKVMLRKTLNKYKATKPTDFAAYFDATDPDNIVSPIRDDIESLVTSPWATAESEQFKDWIRDFSKKSAQMMNSKAMEKYSKGMYDFWKRTLIGSLIAADKADVLEFMLDSESGMPWGKLPEKAKKDTQAALDKMDKPEKKVEEGIDPEILEALALSEKIENEYQKYAVKQNKRFEKEMLHQGPQDPKKPYTKKLKATWKSAPPGAEGG